MDIKIPNTKQTVIDNSEIGTLVDDSLIIGMPIESDTGKTEITHIRSQAELLRLYSETGTISTALSTTMLHALKILQFNSIYVSRAINTKVLPARSDKIGANGSSALYVDDAYQPYYKVWKLAFRQKPTDYKFAFIDVTYTKINQYIVDEKGNYLTSEALSYLLTEDSDSKSKTVRFVGYVTENNVAPDLSSIKRLDKAEVNTTISIDLSKYGKDSVNIDDLLLHLNDALVDTKQNTEGLPLFPKITSKGDYVNLISGLEYKLDDICVGGIDENNFEPVTLDGVIANEVQNDYGLLAFDSKLEENLTLNDYLYIGGSSYFIEGTTNISYPGTQHPMSVYNGCLAKKNNPLVALPTFGKETLSDTGFLVYLIDEQVSSGNLVPSFTDLDLRVTFEHEEGTVALADLTIESASLDESDDPIKSELSKYITINSDGSTKSTISCGTIIKSIKELESELGITGLAIKIPIISESSVTKYLYFCVDNPQIYGYDKTKDYKVTFNDINTFQKLVYRLYEFLYEPNINATNHFGNDNLPNGEFDKPVLQNEFLESIFVDHTNPNPNYVVTRNFPIIGGAEGATEPLYNRSKLIIYPSYSHAKDESIYPNGVDGGDSALILTHNYEEDGPKFYVANTSVFYSRSDIESFSVPAGTYIYDNVRCGALTNEDDVTVFSYNINTAATNDYLRKYQNSYITIEKTINTGTPEESVEYYVFYTGKLALGSDPRYTKVNLSTAKLTYSQFMNELRDKIKNYFISTNLTNGFALYEYDTSVRYRIVDLVDKDTDLVVNSDFALSDQNQQTVEFLPNESMITDYTELIKNSALIVCAKAPNKSNILKFELNVDEDDPELFDLALTRKGSTTNYTISFVPNKVDGYGRSVFYTYVNDEDNGSDDFYLTRLTNDPTFVPDDTVVSPLFGSEVLVQPATTGDFKAAIDRFKEKLGIYYDILFDGGQVNTVVQNYLHNVGRQIFALPVLGMPDIKDWKQLRAYRQSVDINHWEGWMSAPRVPDSTLGEFVLDLVPGTQYIQRIVLNKSGGAEFAPVFGITNGPGGLPPKYKYHDEDIQTSLVNSQINPYLWHRARQLPYFQLDLTMQTKDSSLSDANNVRMVNCMAHIADQISEKYYGRYNDPGTRYDYLAELRIAINQRLIDHQKYRIDDYRLICDETNNPDQIVERRLLVLDIYSKFRPGIREVKVYHTVYKLSQDLYAI